MSKPRKEHTFERDQIKLHLQGLSSSIGAYLRARRVQFDMGWQSLEGETNVKGILSIERGRSFPTNKTELKRLFKILKIKNGDRLTELMLTIENFKNVIKENRFKL